MSSPKGSHQYQLEGGRDKDSASICMTMDENAASFGELLAILRPINILYNYKQAEKKFLRDFCLFLAHTDSQYWRNLLEKDPNTLIEIKFSKDTKEDQLALTTRDNHFEKATLGTWGSFLEMLYISKEVDYGFVKQKGKRFVVSLSKAITGYIRNSQNEISKSPKLSIFLLNLMKLLYFAKHQNYTLQSFLQQFPPNLMVREAVLWETAKKVGELCPSWEFLFRARKLTLPVELCNYFPGAIDGSDDLELDEVLLDFDDSLLEDNCDLMNDERFTHMDLLAESKESFNNRSRRLAIEHEKAQKIISVAKLQKKKLQAEKEKLLSHKKSHEKLLANLGWLQEVEKLKPHDMDHELFLHQCLNILKKRFVKTFPAIMFGEEESLNKAELTKASVPGHKKRRSVTDDCLETPPPKICKQVNFETDKYTKPVKTGQFSSTSFSKNVISEERVFSESEEENSMEENDSKTDDVPNLAEFLQIDVDGLPIFGFMEFFEQKQEIKPSTEVEENDKLGKVQVDYPNLRSREARQDITTTFQKNVLSGMQDGLKCIDVPEKGRGILSTKTFEKNDFVVEYAGELLEGKRAVEREKLYYEDDEIGSYMFFFKMNDKPYCIDATAESGRFGRLLNHSKHGNLRPKSIVVNNIPRIIFLAKRDIKEGEELTYDYGETRKHVLDQNEWLRLS